MFEAAVNFGLLSPTDVWRRLKGALKKALGKGAK
jgi:hypothetical protein